MARDHLKEHSSIAKVESSPLKLGTSLKISNLSLKHPALTQVAPRIQSRSSFIAQADETSPTISETKHETSFPISKLRYTNLPTLSQRTPTVVPQFDTASQFLNSSSMLQPPRVASSPRTLRLNGAPCAHNLTRASTKEDSSNFHLMHILLPRKVSSTGLLCQNHLPTRSSPQHGCYFANVALPVHPTPRHVPSLEVKMNFLKFWNKSLHKRSTIILLARITPNHCLLAS
ncbi:hypothetical protein BUALT_Bualt01G0149800 [Buddleja alternifolia]|uniref:Uncharacterized protein n=1 Tax=Buddleja alternifolia TaxID=168488 RepID=A0AAV6YF12_9LAMI|nr:hypothetical protein BUALT_Bualt01G0149800 [Buddleja alternifolia]